MQTPCRFPVKLEPPVLHSRRSSRRALPALLPMLLALFLCVPARAGTTVPDGGPTSPAQPAEPPKVSQPVAPGPPADKAEPRPRCGSEAFFSKRAKDLGLQPQSGQSLLESVLLEDSTRAMPRHNAYFAQDRLPGGGIARLLIDASIDLDNPDKAPCIVGFWIRSDTSTELEPVHWLETRSSKPGGEENLTELRMVASYKGYKDAIWPPLRHAFLILIGYTPDGQVLFTYNSRQATSLDAPAGKGKQAPQCDEKHDAQLTAPGHSVKLMSRWFSRALGLLMVVLIYLAVGLATWPKESKEGSGIAIRKRGWQGLWQVINPIRISAGYKGEPSMSQLQLFAFTLLLGGMLIYLWAWTGALSEISSDLLILLGVSVSSAAGAKFTAQSKSKDEDETRLFFVERGWFEGASEPAGEPSLRALLCTDGQLDIYKFQMAVFSVVVAAYVFVAGTNGLGQVALPEHILALMGISQLAYVGGKAVTKRSPQLDAFVTQLREKQKQYLALLTEKTAKPEGEKAEGTKTEDPQKLAELERIKIEYVRIAKQALQQFRSVYRIDSKIDQAKVEQIV